MLNQLRSEVKKYPLNKKKASSTNIIKDNSAESKSNQNKINTQEINFTRNSKINNENQGILNSISFNNSKNFSIYNNNNVNDIKTDLKDYDVSNNIKLNQSTTSTTFKDRLNQIDMK
tara:strand:- start:405 stop:755 length:351 start_codon:yes stop_codon:yes gene_type:complete